MHTTTHTATAQPVRRQRATPPATLADLALVDAREVAAAGGMGLSQLYQLVKEGKAPQPCIRGHRFTRWRLADVRAWLASFGADPALSPRPTTIPRRNGNRKVAV